MSDTTTYELEIRALRETVPNLQEKRRELDLVSIPLHALDYREKYQRNGGVQIKRRSTKETEKHT